MTQSVGSTALDDEAVQETARALSKEIARLERRMLAIARDIDRATDARALQQRAELVTRGKPPARGAREMHVIDYATDPPQKLVIALDPAISPRAQAEAWFKAARRYLRGAELGHQRAAATREDIAFLQHVLARLGPPVSPASSMSDVGPLLADPRVARLTRALQPKKATDRAVTKRIPYREFLGHGNARILVGRGARDNDELTTRLAKPPDLFLHVHGAVGAHVIVPRAKGEDVPPELLLDAALLAHHFSAQAADSRSDVTYTERRYVQKRRGAPVGTVMLLRSKVFHLVVDPGRLGRLIASEVSAR